MSATFALRQATNKADLDAFAVLIRHYIDWCQERYAAQQWFVDMAFGHQALDSELEHLGDKYTPPQGKILLAVYTDTAGVEAVLGGVAYRQHDATRCEMKRLFVLPEHANYGIGRALCVALMDEAKTEGYENMLLDTSRDMLEAIALYRSLGFTPCAPYIVYPERLKPMISFMECALTPPLPPT